MLRRVLLLSMTMLAFVAGPRAWGQLAGYIFSAGSGSQTTLSSPTTVWAGRPGGYIYSASTGTYAIGFPFIFGGTSYTTFGVSSSGLVALGTIPTSSTGNTLTGAGSYPILSPFWDGLRISGGVQGCGTPTLRYQLVGSSPSRVLVVEFKQIDLYAFTPTWGTFQVRLYEGSNKIEFWYGAMSTCDVCGQGYGCGWSTSATVGIAYSAASYISVTPNGATATTSTVTPNNSYNAASVPMTNGTMYTFQPCALTLNGRTGSGNGGTITMNNGDNFFVGFQAQVGGQATWKPFSWNMSDASCSGTGVVTISGANANDYYFGTPGTLSRTVNLNSGVKDTIAITFKPTAGGPRPAVLTVTGPSAFSRTFNLSASAPLVNYTGIVPQGGTVGMATGDTLLLGQNVQRHTSQCFTPFTLTNVSTSAQPITYTLTDPTAQYTITGNVSLAANASTTPTVCFNAQGFGPQPANLTVNCGGEIRNFVLYATSAAPGGDIVVANGGALVDSSMQMYRNVTTCVGEESNTIQLRVINRGFYDFRIESAEFYEVDTNYGQGVPNYPFRRNAHGGLVPMRDYFLSYGPGVAPVTKNANPLPIVVPQGQSMTVYISFVPQHAGKRFARAVLRTNGQSRSGRDTNGIMYEGVVGFNLYGRGVGTILSDHPGGGLPQALTFPEIHVQTSAQKWLYLTNNGVCPLRVNIDRLQLVEGDVDEFEIVQRPTANVDPVTHDVMIAPTGIDSVLIRFTPVHVGSRRAGLRLVTNDSNVVIPDITERGVYYVDLYGAGKADLYGEGADLGQALIAGGQPEYRHGVVRYKNTRAVPITIDSITITGTDALDFGADGSTPTWPTKGTKLVPGQELILGVIFAPQGGDTTHRNAIVHMYTSTADIVDAPVTGLAGTRTIVVTPSSLNFGTLGQSKTTRRTVTIASTGTMPLTLEKPVVPPGFEDDFELGLLPRLELSQGQVEYLEVAFKSSTSSGSSASAALEIKSNASNGTQLVQMQGTTARTQGKDDPSVTAPTTGGGASNLASNAEEFSVSGVSGVRDASGMALMQSVPNPGRDLIEIVYNLPVRSDMTLVLFDAQGREVRTMDEGNRIAGEHRLRIDVSNLAVGAYHYQLTANGRSLNRSLVIAR